jgi:hypothetical protein
MTQNNGPTAATVNERVNAMVDTWSDLNTQVKKLKELYRLHIIPDSDAGTQLQSDMVDLEGELRTSSGFKLECEKALVDQRTAVQMAKDNLDDIEAELILGIDAELDGDGKPKYTNDKLRSAALRIAKRDSEAYQSQAKKLRSLENKAAIYQAEIREIENRDKAVRLLYRGLMTRLDSITARLSV